MNSDTVPAEVICRTCHTKHRYRRNPADSRSETNARTRARGGPSGRRTHPGEKADRTPPASARPYSPAETYAEGEWIAHQRYGIGSVKGVRGGKIDVSFETGPRTLIHQG